MVGKLVNKLKIQRLDFWQYILEGGEPCWEGKFGLEEKNPNLDVFGFNWFFKWFYRGFDCKKNWFLSQFGL